MTTAIIGVGNVGSRLATDLVRGGEPVILASNHQANARSLASKLGDLATAAPVPDAVSQADNVVLAMWLDAEKEVISELSDSLIDKTVIDTSNPVGPDGHGGVARTLPDGKSSASVVADMLPAGSHYVKAFGTLLAGSLAEGANRTPEKAVLFYATDDDAAAATAEKLIRTAGFDPMRAGGVDSAIRIEMGGDLHESGGLHGQMLNLDQARAAI